MVKVEIRIMAKDSLMSSVDNAEKEGKNRQNDHPGYLDGIFDFTWIVTACCEMTNKA
jgi:hypothetical protein